MNDTPEMLRKLGPRSKVEEQLRILVDASHGEAEITDEASEVLAKWHDEIVLRAMEVQSDRWVVLYSTKFYDRE